MIRNKRVGLKNKGFTLVELMVGVVVSLISIAVMSYFYVSFNKTSGTSIGGAGMLNESRIAMSLISSDIGNAGFGMVADNLMNCNDAIISYNNIRDYSFALNGIRLIDNTGLNNSNEIQIQYATGSGGVGTSQLLSPYIPDNAQRYDTIYPSNVTGFKNGDLVLLFNGTQCEIKEVTSVSNAVNNQYLKISPNKKYNAVFNVSRNFHHYNLPSSVTNLGGFKRISYRVRDNTLQRKEDQGNWVDLMGNVVALRAQYGVSDQAKDNEVVRWEDPNGDFGGNLNQSSRSRIKAIRIGLVVKNPEKQQDVVTKACDTDTNSGLCLFPIIDDQDYSTPSLNRGMLGKDWDHYRYMVQNKIIPLRNMIWNNK